jgi:hypothetical protein
VSSRPWPSSATARISSSSYAAAKTTPPVTHINLPAAAMGRIGAELLVDQVENSGNRATQLSLAAELVIFKSTGPCREKKGGETAANTPRMDASDSVTVNANSDSLRRETPCPSNARS